MLSAKDPGETITIAFDFSALTASVTSPVVTALYSSGLNDTAPSAMKVGSPQVSGAKVLHVITAGQAGTNYKMRCQATAADGSIYVLADVLQVANA